MTHAIILLSAIAMLLMYLIQARFAQSMPDHNDPDRFFLSTKAHSTEEYGSSQVAYFLQMATVYPFFVFGFGGQWWLALWNTFFYFVGIVFFAKLLPKFNRGSLDLVSKASTPHALIASAHREPRLRVFASGLSIFAFTGLVLFETVWGTTALKSVLGGSTYLYHLTILVFALYMITVLWIGGQRAEIKTAQYQLVIAYVGLHLLTAWALTSDPSELTRTDAPFLFPVIFLVGSYATLRRLINWRQDGTRQLQFLNLLAIASLCIVLTVVARTPGVFSISSWHAAPIAWPKEWIWMLFTMGCLPIFFQFVDMTNWQRLSALSSQPEALVKDAQKGLYFFLLESPLSWLFPIAMGVAAAGFVAVDSNQDPWLAFLSRVTDLSGLLGGTISIFAVVGLLCVFLSTADALLSAIGYAYSYDVNPATRTLMDRIHEHRKGENISADQRRRVTTVGKLATSVMIGTAILLYVVLDTISSQLGAGLLGFFLTLYAPMLAFAPSMLIPIRYGKAASPRTAFLSMLISAGSGVAIGIYSLFASNPIWQWLGVPVCFVLSWVIYMAGFAISRNPVPGMREPPLAKG